METFPPKAHPPALFALHMDTGSVSKQALLVGPVQPPYLFYHWVTDLILLCRVAGAVAGHRSHSASLSGFAALLLTMSSISQARKHQCAGVV